MSQTHIYKKSLLVSMLVGTFVPFVLRTLATSLNHLITIDEKNTEEINDHIEEYQKKRFTNCFDRYTYRSIMNKLIKYLSIVSIGIDDHDNEHTGWIFNLISMFFIEKRLHSITTKITESHNKHFNTCKSISIFFLRGFFSVSETTSIIN
jgi:hypothetical protein